MVDGNSIQYTAALPADALAPGQSIQFTYAASFSPDSLTGLTGDSWVYSGAIFGDPGAFVNIQTVAAPEPSSLGLLTAGFLGLAFAGKRKLRKSIAAPEPEPVRVSAGTQEYFKR